MWLKIMYFLVTRGSNHPNYQTVSDGKVVLVWPIYAVHDYVGRAGELEKIIFKCSLSGRFTLWAGYSEPVLARKIRYDACLIMIDR
jgi:hypothetical protein